VLASAPVATVQLPLPLLDVLADTRTAFFGLCLDAGKQVLRTLMEQDRDRFCGPKKIPDPDRSARTTCENVAMSRSGLAHCAACVVAVR
jgi:hypothetical protein